MNQNYRKIIIVTVVVILALIVTVAGINQALDAYNQSDTADPPQRKDGEYVRLITESLPDMRYPSGEASFSVVAADKLQDNWYRVTIENPQNQDKLYALVYDPKNGAEFMRLILLPSVKFSEEENLTNLSIPRPVMEKMNER